MSELESQYRQFSCPFGQEIDDAFLNLVTQGYAQEVTARFLDIHSARLTRQSDGLARSLAEATACDLELWQVWDPALGHLAQATQSPDADPLFAGAGFALRLAEHACHDAAWEARFATPQRLRCGRWFLPEADHLIVEARGKTLTLSLRAPAAGTVRIVFDRRPEGLWTDALHPCPSFKIGRAHAVLLSDTVSADYSDDVVPATLSGVPDDEMARRAGDAVSFLKRTSPEYIAWIGRFIRLILPYPPGEANITSASSALRPGVIQMTMDPRPAVVAEMLVHEASHQHVFFLNLLGDCDDGSDSQLYYSPVVGRDRPIAKVLLAYHAFANVMLLYRAIQNAGADGDGYCRENEMLLAPQLNTLEKALLGCKNLTPIGRALFEPAHERLMQTQPHTAYALS